VTELEACRFLTRLLLVHGTLADYRLGRLIKYSFYKNIAFAFMLFFFQFFCGFSGQVRSADLFLEAQLGGCVEVTCF
jgi:phospholipid-transporting ATPase